MVEHVHVAILFLSLATIGLLISTIVLGTRGRKTKYIDEKNVCVAYTEKGLSFPNINCTKYPQAATNVTIGFNGTLDTTLLYKGKVAKPTTESFILTDMCPVNVHWHLGTEHVSTGQYDESGTGPSDSRVRRLAAGKTHEGAQCLKYDKDEKKFTTKYDWKYCTGMEVGQTYEVHWPHSKLGACGTKWQYQSPFKTGVFCNINKTALTTFLTDSRQKLPQYAGVQAQVFTIVNDANDTLGVHDFPQLFDGMIVDKKRKMGTDMAYYLGSTTGQKVGNEQVDDCSPYSPITWQVDRKCHEISAKSFDNMCKTMMNQAADMKGDLYPHGSRVMVDANNTAIKNGGQLRG